MTTLIGKKLRNFLAKVSETSDQHWILGGFTIWATRSEMTSRTIAINTTSRWGETAGMYLWHLGPDPSGSAGEFVILDSTSRILQTDDREPLDWEKIWRILDQYEQIKGMPFTEGEIIAPLAQVLGQIPARNRISQDVFVGNYRTLHVSFEDEANDKKLSITVRRQNEVSTQNWTIKYRGDGSVLSVSLPKPQASNFGTHIYPDALEQVQAADALNRLR